MELWEHQISDGETPLSRYPRFSGFQSDDSRKKYADADNSNTTLFMPSSPINQIGVIGDRRFNNSLLKYQDSGEGTSTDQKSLAVAADPLKEYSLFPDRRSEYFKLSFGARERSLLTQLNLERNSFSNPPKFELTDPTGYGCNSSSLHDIFQDSRRQAKLPMHSDNVLLSGSASASSYFDATVEHTVSQLCNFSEEPVQPDLDCDFATQMVRLATEACTEAENIAIAHRRRPCFKNIHSICAKTRSNVQKADAAVANLYSQGIPWVIKNFIFSLLRIIDGWKGAKELMSERHDSFARIEDKYYSPDMRKCFFRWQSATKDMVEMMHKTFKDVHEGFMLEQMELPFASSQTSTE